MTFIANTLLLCVASFFSVTAAFAKPPSLQLAEQYHPQQERQIKQYWVSEKYDGIRAYWNGQQLISRQGNSFAAPAWFIADLPKEALDGELWLGRQQFSETSSIIRSRVTAKDWQQIKYMIFDSPQHSGTFSERLAALQRLFLAHNFPAHIQLVEQQQFQSIASLEAYFHKTIDQGGEGLILHHKNARYQSGRSNNILKYKPYADAEAEVIGHTAGKGKYSGMMGALIIRLSNGKTMKLGSGFSDVQRREPPAIGATITYRYNGFTKFGLPRFARFLRIRQSY